jgi:hypothetical protein
MNEFTEADFTEALEDPQIKKVWEEIENYNKWLSMQPKSLQEEIDRKCRELINSELK